MNSVRMACRLLKNNLKIYSLYLIVLIVSVATYYNFVAIQYNDKFQELTDRLQSATLVSILCGFVLILTVIFFMWHANSFFLKQRQKETGLYMLMGISSSKVGQIFAIESIFLGGLAFIIGLPIGMLISKLFFMLLGKAITLEETLPFQVSPKSIIQVILVFSLIFIALGFRNYNIVKNSQLINMLNATKRKSIVPKLNYVRGILGVILIIIGYIIGLQVKNWEIDLMLASMSTLILVCVGTYLLFGSFLTIIFKLLIRCKKIIYKNSRLIAISNIFFRLQDNYRSLAITAILAASTVTALGVSLSFKQYAVDDVIMESPYSFSYISKDSEMDYKIDKEIEKLNAKIDNSNYVSFMLTDINYKKKNKNIETIKDSVVTSYSQVVRSLNFLDFRDKEKLLKEIKPQSNEATFILNARTMASPVTRKGDDIEVEGNKYHIISDVKVPFIGKVPELGSKNIYVLSDEEYENLKSDHDEITLRGVNLSDESKVNDVVEHVTNIIPNGTSKVFPHVSEYMWEYYALGIFFFLGLIMSIVFMLATFSALYFKTMSDALLDKKQYVVLRKIGMGHSAIKRSVCMQVGIVFLLPVIVGIIHSLIAMSVLEKIMNVAFTLQVLTGVGIFSITMIGFYIAISNNYTNMVYSD